MTESNLDYLMIRKIQAKKYSTESSSSENQEHSKLPNEVLNLGARIVRELNRENSNDTLGRWMAHHLAEMIEQAESAEGEDKTVAHERINDLILRIWSHRQNLPVGAYPLNKLDDVISALWRLRPEASPFRRRGTNETEALLVDIFRHFQNVVAHGIILTSGIKSLPKNLEDFEPFFNENESDLIANVERWIEFHNAERKRLVRIEFVDSTTSTSKTPTSDQDVDEELDAQSMTKRLLCDGIDELIEALSALKSKLATQNEAK